MELPQPNGNWRKISLSLAAGVAVIAVLMMTMVLLPIAPLLPTPEDTAKTDITKPPKAH
jgi:hypothetical protein